MKPIPRRRFLQYGLGAGSRARGAVDDATSGRERSEGRGTLSEVRGAGTAPGRGDRRGHPERTQPILVHATEITRQLHPDLPPTPLWAYDDGSGLGGQAGSFGMAVVAQSGTPLTVDYTHALPETYPSWLPVDTRLTPLGNEVRLMTHLHGGFVAADSDGNPAVTPNGFGAGETQTVFYTNQPPQMPASLLWFHDHGLGTTRLNVFAGLAAAYILRDEFDTGAEPNPIGIPGGAYEIPLVVQDRQFNPDGTFLYPTSDIPGATWIGEYFGDTMLVNGKVWPFLDVEPRMYRFRILNGCNARILSLDIGGPSLWQIGAEGGLFDVPVPVKQLVLAPAERADVLVDFTKFAGGHAGDEEPPAATAGVDPGALARVGHADPGRHDGLAARAHIDPLDPARAQGRPERSGRPPATSPSTRSTPDEPTWFLNLNGVHFDQGPTTETPKVGTVEDWVYINMTARHPPHAHAPGHLSR